jgi:N-methylhydantoinase B
MRSSQNYRPSDPIRLEIYKNFFSSIAEEMGAVLRKSSFSPNIKERRDFSCAVFDQHGNMIAQAAHIPVHLGSMPMSVQSAVQKLTNAGERLSPGDTIIVNDPFLGGTHLPDITLVSPLFFDTGITANDKTPVAFVANRAHHADIGGIRGH